MIKQYSIELNKTKYPSDFFKAIFNPKSKWSLWFEDRDGNIYGGCLSILKKINNGKINRN